MEDSRESYEKVMQRLNAQYEPLQAAESLAIKALQGEGSGRSEALELLLERTFDEIPDSARLW